MTTRSLTTRSALPDASVRSATIATYAAFIGTGFAFANWASRIPNFRDQLQLSPTTLGAVLLAIAVGSLIGLPLSGAIVTTLQSRRTVAAAAVLDGLALIVMAAGYVLGLPVLIAGLLLFGFGQAIWDVAMNVQGAIVEQRLGRAIMSRFHAGFSIGTVVGAAVGALAIITDIPVALHLGAVAIITAVAVPLFARRFLPDRACALDDLPEQSDSAKPLTFWREPRTLLVGLFVLAFAFAEGAGNDWIGIALIDGHQATTVQATIGLAVFLLSMTVGRWFGPNLLERYGRVAVVRVLAVTCALGILLFVFGPGTPAAFIGTALWGLGASLGFPVGVSAGADEPRVAAARVSVIASIGYCGFLAGPPLIGLLGEHITVIRALAAIAMLVGLATLIAGSVAPLKPAPRKLETAVETSA